MHKIPLSFPPSGIPDGKLQNQKSVASFLYLQRIFLLYDSWNRHYPKKGEHPIRLFRFWYTETQTIPYPQRQRTFLQNLPRSISLATPNEKSTAEQQSPDWFPLAFPLNSCDKQLLGFYMTAQQCATFPILFHTITDSVRFTPLPFQ